MIRLVLGLGAAIFAVMALVGADRGQQRLGLEGGYHIVTKLPDLVPVVRPAIAEVAATPAVFVPAQPVRTAPVAQPEPVVAEPAPAPRDIRRVVANSVNVRGGPSTGDAVIDRLTLGEEVLVVGDPDGEWLHIRIEGDGLDGFVAARFLGAAGG